MCESQDPKRTRCSRPVIRDEREKKIKSEKTGKNLETLKNKKEKKKSTMGRKNVRSQHRDPDMEVSDLAGA